jgi:energy-coupling factor transporter ATP-binding protein EcfA2
VYISEEDPLSSPLHSILAWSQEWPSWQRDALRRIVLNGQLSTSDKTELQAICKAEQEGTTKEGRPQATVPLSSDHFPSGPNATTSISLLKIGALKNVNRFPSDRCIEFGSGPGLTVVYGENGSGKSGYVRVLKKACRARGTVQEIKPNAFAATNHDPATAEIVCTVGSVVVPCIWTNGLPSDPRLGNVFVFDAASAHCHVAEDGPAVFTPRGLDVLPKLARACDDLKAQLKAESDGIVALISQTASGWKVRPHTKVGVVLGALAANTKVTDIERLAQFTATDQKRLTELTDALKSDPKQKAQATRASSARIRTFAALIEGRAKALEATAVGGMKAAVTEAAAATAAAKATEGPHFDDSFLPGTGGDAWRSLWDMARAFSGDAYPDQDFPVSGGDARCVLCQQLLSTDGRTRFERFDAYVRDEARVRSETASAKAAELKRGIYAMSALEPELAKVVTDLQSESVEAKSPVELFVQHIDARLIHVQKCLRDCAWVDPPTVSTAPVAYLNGVARALDQRADMELSVADEDTRKVLTAEKEELEDREWLAIRKKEVLDQIARHKTVASLKKCQDDTSTNKITIKNGELYDALVTKAFCNQFAVECRELGLKTLAVKLESVKGAKGERKFGVRLEHSTTAKVIDIASEGEHTCIALAAFLAELSQASHRSALIFDDPVSSLDHHRRAAIAARLVAESKIRQVLVFTHDLAFVCDLQTFAHEHGIEIHGRHLDWSSTGPGRCHGEFPWDGQSHKAQMKTLREMCGKAFKMAREEGQAEYRAFAQSLCNLVRAASERVVEEELFNHVLHRHESRVQVGRLESVGAVDGADYRAVHSVWKACSDVVPSHASSRAKPAEVPAPEKLKELVDTLEQVVLRVKARRQPQNAATGPPHLAGTEQEKKPKPKGGSMRKRHDGSA